MYYFNLHITYLLANPLHWKGGGVVLCRFEIHLLDFDIDTPWRLLYGSLGLFVYPYLTQIINIKLPFLEFRKILILSMSNFILRSGRAAKTKLHFKA